MATDTNEETTGWRLADDQSGQDEGRWQRLPRRLGAAGYGPEDYVPSSELLDAIDTAISVGQPLVLTGEPGVGKTSFAEHVAWRLGLPEIRPRRRALRFDVKSTTQGRDLLYRYDALGHYNAANIRKEEVQAHKFIDLEALGNAILRTRKQADVKNLIGRELPDHQDPIRSVVLIDEIDKAPRDVPNNLLREIEEMSFRIPELGTDTEVAGDPKLRPIVIITSNRETPLPDAFMRRCCFYHLPFPAPGMLAAIVAERLSALPHDASLVSDAINLITEVRKAREGRGRPSGTSELLSFLEDLTARGYGADDRLYPDSDDWKRVAARVFLAGDRDDPETIAKAAEIFAGDRGAA